MTIEIKVDDAEVLRALSQLTERVQDLSPVMREIAGVMEDASQRAFRDEADPATGAPWAELRPSTLKRRAKIGRGPRPILQISGLLAKVQREIGEDFAAVGSPMIYAPTHQFGAAKGQYGRTTRGSPIPWGDIPARPFLGLGPDDVEEIQAIIRKHLEQALR